MIHMAASHQGRRGDEAHRLEDAIEGPAHPKAAVRRERCRSKGVGLPHLPHARQQLDQTTCMSGTASRLP